MQNSKLGIWLCCFSISLITACDSSSRIRDENFARGNQYFQAGDYQQARLAYQCVLEIDANHIDALYKTAEASAKLGDTQQAIEFYQKIVNLYPKHLWARIQLAHIYLMANQVDAAETLAQEAMAIDPENPDSMLLSSKVLAAQSHNDKAIVMAEAALAKRSADLPAIALLASLWINSGEWDKATALLLQHIVINPTDTSLRLMLVNLYIQNQADAKALDVLEAIVKIEPASLLNRERLALFLLEQHKLDKAETVLRDAVMDLPESTPAKINLLDFLVKHRSPEIAEAEVIPMLEDHPEDFVLKFGLVNLYRSQNLLGKAEQALREIIDLDQTGKQGAKAKVMLARLQMDTGHPDQAKALLQALLNALPDYTEAIMLRGELALADNHLSEAIRDFRSVLSAQPNAINVLKLLGSTYQLNQDLVSAIELFEKIVQLQPQDETARLDLAELLVKTGHTDKALQQISILLDLMPASQRGLEALFQIYLSRQQWEQAGKVAELLQQSYPNEASGYYLAGLANQAAGQLVQGIANFSKALSKQSDAIEPLTQLINSYLQSHQPDLAVKTLTKLIKQQPNHFVAYNLLGNILMANNRAVEAASAFNKVISIKPEWDNPYHNLATLYMNRNLQDQAIQVLQQGIEQTDSVSLVKDLATIYHHKGESDKAIALLENAYQHQPQSTVALHNLVRYLSEHTLDQESLNRAVMLAEPLANTGNPDMLFTLAVLAYQQGHYEKAKTLLIKVTEQVPDSAIARYQLGMVYYKLGHIKPAHDQLNRALEEKVDFNGIEEAKKTLKAIDESLG